MQVRELNLVAFGPFTDRTLKFDQEAGGFHIVYGLNEAGKSSALRGLKALLYGIDERTTDNFIHDNDKMRVEGYLHTEDGQELAFARRKGRKNTLLSLEGEPLDEKALAPFLQGVTLELFEMLFGIDFSALVQGGQEILEQKGDVGQALFSTSLGSHELHTVLNKLDNEADELFKARGSTPTINSDLKTYTGLKKEIKDRSLSSREWDEHSRTLAKTTQDMEQIQTELTGNRTEVNRLKRIQRTLPKLARRQELLQRLETLGNVIALPDDFSDRRQKALMERETAQAILKSATSRLNGLQEQLEGLSVHQAILEQSENIDDIHARLGGHRKAMQDKPSLVAEYKQLLTDAESLIKDVRPGLALEDVEVLRPVLMKRQRITEMGNNNPVLVSRVKETEKSLRDTEALLEFTHKKRQQLPNPGSPEALRRATAVTRKLGDVDSAIQSSLSELATLQSQCAADLARLTLWSGSLENLPALPVPNRESISRFDEEYAELDKSTQRLWEKQEEMAEKLLEASHRLDEIQRAGTVPTEVDLSEARSSREQAWQLLRRQWIDGEDVNAEARAIDAELGLPDVFEVRVINADELADRLRRETDRVLTQASLLAEQENVKQRTSEIVQQLDKCTTDKKQKDAEWAALWAPCDIQPRTPREMRAWLDKLEKLRDQIGQLTLLRQQINDSKHIRDSNIQLLKRQLQNLGKEASDSASLEAVLLESEEVLDELEEIKRRRDVLDNEINTSGLNLESCGKEHQAASSKLDVWKAQWKKAVEGFGLEGDALPSEVADIIDKLRDLFDKQSEAKKLRIRILAIDEDAESFRNQVNSMVTSVAPEFERLTADEAVVQLNALLLENRTRQSQRQHIEEQLQLAQQDIQDSEATIQIMTERMDELCVNAKCDNHSELEEAERRSDEHLRLKVEVGSVEQGILEEGEGATLAELDAEAKGVNPDMIPGQIETLTSKIEEELEPRRTALAENKGRLVKELELMDGSDHAAALADQGQSVLANIRSNSERYVRLKLAARILRDEIERYRQENQGPLVKSASEHFAVLTRGSFEKLMTDFNEKDEPVLVGIRPNEERVHVEGMSSGTRDQLYLALRLAALEKYMEKSESMPFIVDDILVDFDDERSEAALTALAQLAQTTQVILFTHHSLVVEQAKKLGGSTSVHIHEL